MANLIDLAGESARQKACEKYTKLPSNLGTARVNQFPPLTYDSESEGGVQKQIQNLSRVSRIPSNQKIHFYSKFIQVLPLHTFKPAEARTRWNLTVISDPDYAFKLFGKSTSLRQNILSAIK